MIATRHFVQQLSVLTLRNIIIFRTRVLLTIAGIVFGTVSVISTFTINGNLSQMAEAELMSAGMNLLTVSVSPSASSVGVDHSAFEAIRKFCSKVEEVIPFTSDSNAIDSFNRNAFGVVYGVGMNYFSVKKMKLTSGRTLQNWEENSRVAIVGATISKVLFGNVNPVGNTVLVRRGTLFPFRVIGVLESQPKYQLLAESGDPDNSIYIPYMVFKNGLGIKSPTSGLIVARSESEVKDAAIEITQVLSSKYSDGIEILDPHAEIEKAKSLTNGIIYSGLTLGILTLITGGMGIMNIMLVSIMQRKREIGLYKAIGFEDRVILIQFLAESLVICLLGALIGSILGAPAGVFASRMVLKGYGNVNFISIIISWAFSISVGLIFGYLPARRASLLDPVEALKN